MLSSYTVVNVRNDLVDFTYNQQIIVVDNKDGKS